MSGIGLKVRFIVFIYLVETNTSCIGAQEAAEEGGMVSGVLDLSYMGVHTIWANLLGMYAPPLKTTLTSSRRNPQIKTS